MQPSAGAALVSEPGFLVTGSGRSGTKYLATLLRSCGLNVGHEQWWTLDPSRTADLDGDVSWMGCFDHSYNGPIYLQARNPLSCIPSIYGRENRHPWHLLRRLTARHSGDWAVDAASIWLEYNYHALHSARAWWRVEDIDADLLVEHFGVDRNRAVRALDSTPRDINGAGPVDYPWPSIVVDSVLELAHRLGYEIADPRGQ